MNNKFVVGIVLTAIVLAAMAVPAMARTDDVVFYFNTSDGSHEITLAPDEEVTIYFDADAPVNETGGFEMALLFDPNVVECLDMTENESVTNWMLWTYRGVYNATDGLSYMNFDALDFAGAGPSPPNMRCGDIRLKAVGPGETTLYLGMYPDDIPNIDHSTSIGDIGSPISEKDWTYATSPPFKIICAGSPTTFTKSLAPGWNLISLPLTPSDSSVSTVLSGVSQDAVMQYDATTKTFTDATTMDPGIGYFVDVTSASTWEYEGTSVSSTSPGLKSGLNMIGVPNCAMSVSDGMGPADYRYVARWNADDQKYEVYNPSAPAAFHHFDTMAAGEGYFISAGSDDDTFAISCP